MKKCFSVMVGLYLGTAELFGMDPQNSHGRSFSENTSSSEHPSTRNKTVSVKTPKELEEFYTNLQHNRNIREQQIEEIINDNDNHQNLTNKYLDKILKNEKESFQLNNTGNGSRYTARYTYRSNETTGKITITEKYGIVKITVWIYKDYLDLTKKIEITAANEDQPYTFEIINNTQDTESLILLPVSFITQINEVVPCDKFVCLKFQGGNEGFVVNSEGFYIGDINNDQATGTGEMLTKTGKILHGIFDHGVFMEENDHIHKKFLEILSTYKEVTDGKN